ncbi:MAG: hypothetical protein GY749_00870 [Desulfobacteraceae bacterium]|nr:hypothetical protein [Desulfobacteraceae bacterium]
MEPFEISNSDFTEWDSALLVQHYQTMLHPTDLAKKVGFRPREIKKDMQYLIDNGELAYYHLGCTTCIMLKKDYELQSEKEMLTVSNA